MASTLFESDVTITDSAGATDRGLNGAARLFERYSGFEPGIREVAGNQVLWTEALPIRTSDNLQFQQEVAPELLSEVPRYALVQAMCAVVTNGRIHVVIALSAAKTFAHDRHCNSNVGR
jgi:hypothetical protein